MTKERLNKQIISSQRKREKKEINKETQTHKKKDSQENRITRKKKRKIAYGKPHLMNLKKIITNTNQIRNKKKS
jgi:hypothetical protein